MTIVATRDIVIAKIISQGCIRRSDLDDDVSLYFSTNLPGHTDADPWVFGIPQPIEEDGYSLRHLIAIEAELDRLDLELLPLDPNLAI